MGSVLVLAYLHCYQFSDVICVELRIFLFLLRRIVYRQPNHLHVIYKLTEQQKHMTCLKVFVREKMKKKKVSELNESRKKSILLPMQK